MTRRKTAALLSIVAALVACSTPERKDTTHVGSTSSADTSDSHVYSSSYTFNSTPIPAGSTIWFTSSLTVDGSSYAVQHVVFSSGTIRIVVNGVPMNIAVPDGVVTLDPSVGNAGTSFDSNGRWQTSVSPQRWSRGTNAFVSGFPWVVPSNLPGNVTITWTSTVTSDTQGLSGSWQVSAATYDQLGSGSALQVKPVDDGTDNAGCPEAWKSHVRAGAGGDGHDYTGGRSSPVTFNCGFDRCQDLVACPAPADACHVKGVCQPSTGQCSAPNAPNGTACAMPNANATCQSGACTVVACFAGYGDCNGDCNQQPGNGCETQTNTVSNCGGCGIECRSRPNSVATCTAAGCGIACSAGYGNCDGNLSNGCETITNSDTANCGGCGIACSAGALCTNGACVDTAPGVPSISSVIAGNGQATVTFKAPSSNGGAAITSYTVTSNPGGITATGTGSPIVVSGLTDGKKYTFTVTATNAVGTSAASPPSSSTSLPLNVPGAPALVSAVAGNGQAIIAFTAPASNGGSAITKYTVTSSPGGQTATGTASPLTVTGLSDGTAYTFTVTATNTIGTSAASNASSATPAGPPGTSSVTSVTPAGNGTASVAFTAAANDGSAITKYTVTSSPGGIVATGAGSPITISGLTPGVAYTFVVSATNALGMGPTSAPSSTPFTATGPPGAPAITSVSNGGDGTAVIAFNASSTTGGSPVTGFTVTSNPGGFTASGTASPLTITGLTDGTSYTFTITATNAAGTSASSAASGTDIPLGPPGAPAVSSVSAGNGQATVSFTPPATNGGSAITSYTVVAQPGGASASSSTSPITVSPLSDGVAYTFTVVATNAAGTSSASAASASTTPVGAPSAPSITGVTSGGGSATIAFSAPANNGGLAVSSYTVTSIPDGLTATGTGSPLTIAGLTDGQSYTFTVSATNAAGTSADSQPSTNGVVPTDAPGAPTITGVTAGNGSAAVAFTPGSTGGLPTTSYTVTSSPGGIVAVGSASPIIVSGLTDGVGYTFTVSAANDDGSGPSSSASTPITPTGPPAAPAITSVAVSSTPDAFGQAVVSFSTPANNGLAITGYTVIANPGGITASGGASPLTLTGLSDGTSYTFTVVASNAAGQGAASFASAPATPSGPPAAPSISGLAASDGATLVTVSAPANNGGSPITEYTVMSDDGTIIASAPATGSLTSVEVTGLVDGMTYTFMAVATNANGASPASAESGPDVPTGPPGAATVVSVTAGDGTATVSFSPPSFTGGLPITGYTVTSSPGGLTATGFASPITISGLTDNTPYTFTVTAANVDGSSGASPVFPATGGILPGTVPAAPAITTVQPLDGAVSVSFVAQYNGGLPITSYTVTTMPGGAVTTGGASPIIVSNLVDGAAYTFTVSATNSAGQGAASTASASLTPLGLPGAPTITAVATNGNQATVAFTPGSNGGASSVTYTVTSNPGGLTASGSSSPIVVTGLTDGVSYTFTAFATNVVGDGPASMASNIVVTLEAPGAPSIGATAASDGQVVVTVVPPAFNGGSAITSYTVTSSPGGGSASAPAGLGPTPVVVTGLTDGVAYTFSAVATNGVGSSAPSAPSVAGVSSTPSAPPGAPTITNVTMGVGDAVIAFSPPASNGGYPITSYTVTSNAGDTASGTSSPLTISGLTAGVSYSFTVTAANIVGTSAASPVSGAETALGAPSAPAIAAVVPGDAQVTVVFNAPASNGGLPITQYVVTANPGGEQAIAAASPIVVSGLTDGVAYTFTVTATNGAGTGPASTVATAIPVGVPSPPGIIDVEASGAGVAVTFAPPVSNGGEPVLFYTVTANPGGQRASGTSSPILVTGLSSGVSYAFTVTATNAAGSSAPSQPLTRAAGGGLPCPPVITLAAVAASGEYATIILDQSACGGTPTQWTVTSTPDVFGPTVATTSSPAAPIFVPNLQPGTQYAFSVVASNSVGYSPATSTPGVAPQVIIANYYTTPEDGLVDAFNGNVISPALDGSENDDTDSFQVQSPQSPAPFFVFCGPPSTSPLLSGAVYQNAFIVTIDPIIAQPTSYFDSFVTADFVEALPSGSTRPLAASSVFYLTTDGTLLSMADSTTVIDPASFAPISLPSGQPAPLQTPSADYSFVAFAAAY